VATTLATIATRARVHLIEPTASYWSDAELVQHAIYGCQDLWRSFIDNYQDYFLTIDETNVTQDANGTSLSGVPTDVFRVKGIEPRTLADSQLLYVPLDFTHPDFQRARATSAVEASSTTIFYDLIKTAAPVGAPTIRVAPPVSSQVLLRLIYIPTLAALTSGDNNPIPGESDNAVMAWTVAYARAKEREDRSPDPEWLAIYATEKQHILQAVTPRQDDENDYVEALFEPYWSN
jgi:hypothetical protein